jgi:phospholipid transport system substrate-binding protein
MRYLAGSLLVWCLAGAVLAATAAEPDVLVRQTTEEILKRIKTNKDAYSADTKKLYAMVDELVVPHFDFTAMSKLVLGQNWRNASAAQREGFTKEFRDLLVRTYSTALLKYTNEEIIYLPYRGPLTERTAEIRVEVKSTTGARNVPLAYSFFRREAKEPWKVYDVTIDGVSLVTSFKTTYAERVQRNGLDALIAQLAKDNREGKIEDPVGKSVEAKSKGSK